VKERPILFSGPMVRAILGGSKTQTRRPVMPQPSFNDVIRPEGEIWKGLLANVHCRCPFGQPGDRLWVRETAWYDDCFGGRAFFENGDVVQKGEGIISKAPHPCSREMFEACGLQKCRPSIHMPRWASRLTLEVTAVRVERISEISERDAQAEGVAFPAPYSGIGGKTHPTCIDAFRVLWDEINGRRTGYTWADNPWVWAIKFRRVDPCG
jgi:hypothetical protein